MGDPDPTEGTSPTPQGTKASRSITPAMTVKGNMTTGSAAGHHLKDYLLAWRWLAWW